MKIVEFATKKKCLWQICKPQKPLPWPQFRRLRDRSEYRS